ncbi:MAG TPA: GerAB/ArcD/ProY family transporter, partial [Bacillota bacterium]|nr:GerAB/ArcD/ProY family transporter [Bacillota bacterium]
MAASRVLMVSSALPGVITIRLVSLMAGVLMVIPLAVWLVFLGNSLPSNTIFELLEKGLGKPVLIPMGLVFIVINIAIAVTQLNMFTQMINVY